jgi:hypothetical protein
MYSEAPEKELPGLYLRKGRAYILPKNRLEPEPIRGRDSRGLVDVTVGACWPGGGRFGENEQARAQTSAPPRADPRHGPEGRGVPPAAGGDR